MENTDQLPPRYRRLEYIQYKPSQRYLLYGFKSQEEADKRIAALHKQCVSAEYEKMFQWQMKIKEWGILLPKEAIPFLTKKERQRVVLEPANVSYGDYQPIVYRFMDEQYVDEFLATGKLMLTTQKRCKKLENSARQDCTEGHSTLIGHDEDIKCEIESSFGDDVLMLCTSLSRDNKKNDETTYPCCLEINDVFSFSQVLTKNLIDNKVPVRAFIKGSCVYSDRQIERHTQIPKEFLDQLLDKTPGNKKIDFGEFFKQIKQIGKNDIFFQKPISFAHEHEYRFVWCLEKSDGEEQFFVTCREAIQYCRKIKF